MRNFLLGGVAGEPFSFFINNKNQKNIPRTLL